MATAVLVVAVGLLGLRVLGQSNTSMVSLGELQKLAFAYGKLQSAVFDVRLLLAENVSADFYKLNNPRLSLRTDRTPTSVDQATANALARIGPATVVEGLGFVPPPGDDRVLRQIRKKTRQLAAVMEMVVASDQRGGTVQGQVRLRHRAEQLAIDLNQLASELANATTAKTEALIAE